MSASNRSKAARSDIVSSAGMVTPPSASTGHDDIMVFHSLSWLASSIAVGLKMAQLMTLLGSRYTRQEHRDPSSMCVASPNQL